MEAGTAFIALSFADRELDAVEHDAAVDVAHAAVEPDQALAERRLAAARLAGEPHDLAVGDRERDAVERLHVAASASGSRRVRFSTARLTSHAASG